MHDFLSANMVTMPVGPTDMIFPADWTIVPSEHEGLIIATLPIDDEMRDTIESRITMLPNIVVRFFMADEEGGGVARAAADCTKGLLEYFPGSSLLSWDYFQTDHGLTGREMSISGLESGVAFTQWHWFVGAAGTVVEISLTLPAGLSGDFLDLGRAMACSVRLTQQYHGPSRPVIPHDAVDSIATAEIGGFWGNSRISETLEVSPSIPELSPEAVPLPGVVHTVPEGILDTLRMIHQSGPLGGFSTKLRSTHLRTLERMDWVRDGVLTREGHQAALVTQNTPDIHGVGHMAGHTTFVDVWMEGDRAIALLGPTASDLVAGRDGIQYLVWEHYRSVPAILAAWSGMHATWPLPIATTVDIMQMQTFIGRDIFWDTPTPELLDFNGPEGCETELLQPPWSFWALELPGIDLFPRWIHTATCGPLNLVAAMENMVRLESVVPQTWYDSLVEAVDRILASASGDPSKA